MAEPAWFWCYGSAAVATGPINDYMIECRFCGLDVEVVGGLIAEHGAVELPPMGEVVLSGHLN